MDQLPEIVALKETLAVALAVPEWTNPAVEKSVGDTVRVLKAQGWPIERVIVLLKSTVFDAGLGAGRNPDGRGFKATISEMLAENVVQWCITAYFPDDEE